MTGLPQPRDRLPTLGFVLLFAVALGWGVNWPIMKVALNELSPWTFRMLVVPTGGAVLLMVARISGLPLAVPRSRWPTFALVAALNVTGWHVFTAYGIGYMASGRAVLIGYTMPLWASFFGVFVLGEAMTLRRAGALALGIAGMAALMWGGFGALGSAPAGPLFMVTAAISWGLGTVLLKRFHWETPVLPFTGWLMLIGGLPITVVALADGLQPLGDVSAAAWAAVLYNVLGAASIFVYCWFKAVSLFPAGVSAIGTLMIPVVGAASGALMLDEPLGPRELSALVLVCSSLALILSAPPAGLAKSGRLGHSFRNRGSGRET